MYIKVFREFGDIYGIILLDFLIRKNIVGAH